MSTSQRAVMPCSWGVKAGMVRVWVAGKTVWSPCYTRAISERFRDKGLIIKRYINSSVYFTLLTDPKPAMDSLSIWLPRHKRPGSSCPHSACWEWDYLYAIKNKQLIWLQCSYKNRLTSVWRNTRPSVISSVLFLWQYEPVRRTGKSDDWITIFLLA